MAASDQANTNREYRWSLKGMTAFVHLFHDCLLKLKCISIHFLRSWSFLKLQHYLDNPIPATELHTSTANGADTIIGMIDTGIWPESKSFSDKGMAMFIVSG